MIDVEVNDFEFLQLEFVQWLYPGDSVIPQEHFLEQGTVEPGQGLDIID